MVIVNLTGGVGNQLFQYAAGRRLAHKWNTELKLDTTFYKNENLRSYVLNLFNITAATATPKEIERLKKIRIGMNVGQDVQIFRPEVLDWADDIYIHGCFENERYFADASDIIRKEFTLKQPLSPAAQRWKEKILAAKCSVSMHVRHGDNISSPLWSQHVFLAPLQLDHYYACINTLRKKNKNLKVFVFSNNVHWVKKNLRTDVPTEFVSGEGLSDVEELYLMSICKHNIIANSTFSWWGAWLNQNPDKKVFAPIPVQIVGTKTTFRGFSAERNENSPLDSDKWIRVPFDLNNRPDITIQPYFSILLVVNNDAATIQETLSTILHQNYKFYELIVIDNASTDGSENICRQIAKARDNVTFIGLYEKITNGAAWNKALGMAQGNFVLFINAKDRFLNNALSKTCLLNETVLADIVSSVAWLKEDKRGDIEIAKKKFLVTKEAAFRNLNNNLIERFDKPTILKILSDSNAAPLATKFFKRNFLLDNEIRFNEKIDSKDAELLFMVETMFQAKEILLTPNVFYVAPKNF